ncbi:MAG: hypothetical protein ABEH47_08600 [Haloferacaceae archaeon]
MRLGILDAAGLVASLVFAVPVGVAGGQFLLDGRTALGATLLVVAALMVAVPRYVVAPQDLPGELAARVVGLAVAPPDDAEGGEPDVEDTGTDDR